jgi:biopolymer transport protein ExbD
MKFSQQAKLASGLHPINVVAMVNVIFLLLMFSFLTSWLTSPLGINVQMPKAITSDIIKDENLVIVVTGEDIVYFNKSIATIKELKTRLSKTGNRKLSVLIKADRRASMGRIVDVWNVCRAMGVERINIATNEGQ